MYFMTYYRKPALNCGMNKFIWLFNLKRHLKKKVMFAEAGVGTGKTIAYLLYAICYARYTNRPAIIACADETLIEQLVKKEGDIARLEAALHLNIDVRLAKSREQYLCLNKLDKVNPDWILRSIFMTGFRPLFLKMPHCKSLHHTGIGKIIRDLRMKNGQISGIPFRIVLLVTAGIVADKHYTEIIIAGQGI